MDSHADELQGILGEREGAHLECKEAKQRYDFEKLAKYCAALANEGGGRMVLGVTNALPRRVVGTHAFEEPERTAAGLFDRLRLRITWAELRHPDGRVLVFHVPPHPKGIPVEYEGAHWMRAGDDVRPMTHDMLKHILDEASPDFSAETCREATVADLDPAAIRVFRTMWSRKAQSEKVRELPDEQLLHDGELLQRDGVTYAALILLGTREALGRLNLAQAEVVFEYRSTEAAGPAQERKEYRAGFLTFYDDLWNTINLRNDKHHYQEGLFIRDIATFSEPVVREAYLNAISHRDYRREGSVLVRQFARRMVITSPGGFLPGINAENVLWRQAPRNRRIAEALSRCGLVERAGHGVRRMFEESIRESKPRPDFSGSDDYQVVVNLSGEVQDTNFVRFLEKVGGEREASFSTEDFLVLDHVNRGQPVPDELRGRVPALVDTGVLERAGHGRGARFTLSRKFYQFTGRKGTYTRVRGLDRETNKELLLRHLKDNCSEGSPLNELHQVLPGLSIDQVQKLLRELKAEQLARCVGRTRSGRWYPGGEPS
jgi:ATP-dependent DNA helicase RecG